MKEDTLSSEGSRPYLQCDFSSSHFFEFARKETRLDDASGRSHFYTSSGNRIAFFLLLRFFAYSCKRDDRQDTHVYFAASLLRFVVIFSERAVSRQSHSVPTRLGWRISRLSDIRSVKLWITTSGQWSIRYIRYPSDLLKYSMYHSPCTLRFAWTIVVVFIHDVHRNYFTKVSLIFLFRVRNFKSSNLVEHCRRIWIREKLWSRYVFIFIRNYDKKNIQTNTTKK